MIHNILLMKKSGEPIFNKNYSEHKLDVVLTCGFLSATLSFTNVTFDANINDMELGPFRIMFETENELDFVIISFTDKSDSIISIRKLLLEIKNQIKLQVGPTISHILSDQDDQIVNIINEVLKQTPKLECSEQLMQDFKFIMIKLQENYEILDSELLYISGVPLFGKEKRHFVQIATSQMDTFWKQKSTVVDQIIIHFEEQYIILQKVNESLIMAALIRKKTPIGMSTLLIEEAADKIKSILNFAVVQAMS